MEKHIKGYSFLRGFLGFGFKLVYQIKITGKENIPASGPVVVCGNHNHVHDQFPVILSTKRMIHYMAKKEYFDGHFAWFFKAAGCIPVDRSKKDNNATSLALEVLKEGKALGLFPEGTRNKTDKFLLPFKFGAVSMASKTNALIVPFGITGDYKFRSKNLTVRFGKPFKVEGDLEEANKKLEKEVEKLMRESMK